MTREQSKQQIVRRLADLFGRSDSVFVVDPTGQTVQDLQRLRAALGDRGTLVFVKNTLARRAAAAVGALVALHSVAAFRGQSMLVFVTGDPDHAARVLYPMTVRAAWIDRRPATPGDVAIWAHLPSRQEQHARLAALFAAVPARLAAAVAAYATTREDTP